MSDLFTEQQLLGAVRAKHPELGKLSDGQLMGEILRRRPDVASRIDIGGGTTLADNMRATPADGRPIDPRPQGSAVGRFLSGVVDSTPVKAGMDTSSGIMGDLSHGDPRSLMVAAENANPIGMMVNMGHGVLSRMDSARQRLSRGDQAGAASDVAAMVPGGADLDQKYQQGDMAGVLGTGAGAIAQALLLSGRSSGDGGGTPSPGSSAAPADPVAGGPGPRTPGVANDLGTLIGGSRAGAATRLGSRAMNAISNMVSRLRGPDPNSPAALRNMISENVDALPKEPPPPQPTPATEQLTKQIIESHKPPSDQPQPGVDYNPDTHEVVTPSSSGLPAIVPKESIASAGRAPEPMAPLSQFPITSNTILRATQMLKDGYTPQQIAEHLYTQEQLAKLLKEGQ